jgi:predicted DNA-binding ribbon-helix-helix protein
MAKRKDPEQRSARRRIARRSAAWGLALDAVARVPATAGDVRSRNVSIEDRRTSVRFDEPTWRAVRDIAQREALTLDELCALIAEAKPRRYSLSAAIRCYVVGYLLEAASAHGKSADQAQAQAQAAAVANFLAATRPPPHAAPVYTGPTRCTTMAMGNMLNTNYY